ncbi:N-acyl-phosphatidylethanolamine-hydrolyzing phospholipase D-like isoform X2 [Haliotis rufescens]|nr:N-acyl-phosphatidylethanolamine-hydrolyzing phospholipase D-like isoform X2 [Haliotis rufescens]XP_048252802.1 N-acyl-phosphatidylethanolamine-hydrolyzing phospholipase D-like isoform X2 [Haliotis rufescens]
MASADNSSSERMDTPPSEGTMATGAIPEDGLTRSVFKNGYYENPWPTWKRINWANVLKFFFWEKNNSDVPKKEVLNEELPICTPDFGGYEKSPLTGVRTMWVGHATVLVQFDNVTILTDPVFSNRCSPSQWFGPKRYRKPPCKVEDLPKVDAVVISHNHYDHLDYYSVVALNKKFGASLRWYVPMGLKEWMVSTGCQNVQELDWWQEAEHATADGTSVKFVCTPCQHWSKRTPTDDFRTLWSSWSVIGPKHRFFFGGDTGYCEVFKQIGHKYGPFSLAAIPIGAYEPRWFMHPQHVNPKESVQIHEDVQSRMSVGIHWGTFTLTNEVSCVHWDTFTLTNEVSCIHWGTFTLTNEVSCIHWGTFTLTNEVSCIHRGTFTLTNEVSCIHWGTITLTNEVSCIHWGTITLTNEVSCIHWGTFTLTNEVSCIHWGTFTLTNEVSCIHWGTFTLTNKISCIHWGTFTLTNEPILEPREKLKEELKQKNLDLAEFITLHHGEVTVLAEDAYQKVD